MASISTWLSKAGWNDRYNQTFGLVLTYRANGAFGRIDRKLHFFFHYFCTGFLQADMLSSGKLVL